MYDSFDTKNETSNFDFKPMIVKWDMFGDVGIYSYLVHFFGIQTYPISCQILDPHNYNLIMLQVFLFVVKFGICLIPIFTYGNNHMQTFWHSQKMKLRKLVLLGTSIIKHMGKHIVNILKLCNFLFLVDFKVL